MEKSWSQIPFTLHDMRDKDYCAQCPMNCRTAITYVPFEIIGNNPKPKILFIAQSPFIDEFKAGRPLIGKAGTLLRDLIGDTVKEYALANVVGCHPTNTKNGPIPPDETTIQYCLPHVHQFIEQIDPKVIFLLGAESIQSMLPESIKKEVGKDLFTVGKMVTRLPDWVDGRLYACMYHPSYLARTGGIEKPNAVKFRTRLESVLSLAPESSVKSRYDLTVKYCTMNQLLNVLKLLENYNDIGLDYEALDLDPWSEKNRVTGFSLSIVVEGDRGRSFFITVDRQPTEEEKAALITFFKSKSIWTYNAKYEMNTTWAWLGERIHFNDAFCLCKIDCAPQSLKINSQRYVGAELYEEDVYDIISLYETIFEEIDKLQKDFLGICELLRSGNFPSAKNLIEELDEKKSKKFKKILESVDALFQYITLDELCVGLQKYPYAWGAVPIRLLGEYCAWDSFLTLKLKEHFWEKYGKFYPFYRSQTWVCGTMEAYGYNWDDEKAEEHYQYYMKEASTCLFELIKMIDLSDEIKCNADCIYFSSETWEKKLETLKELFNPMSNDPKAQAPFWSSYKTERVSAWCLFLYLEKEILQNEDLNEEKFIKAIDKESVETTLRQLYKLIETEDEKDAIDSILKRSKGKLALNFNRFAIEVTEFQYEAHKKYGGVEIDKEETWNDEFRMLYYLKRFKKVMKCESTYIRGKIGRNLVRKATYESLRIPPRRKESYEEAVKTLKDNERWILNTTYMENGADTKRWRAGIHTVPAHSELREIYTTRSKTAVMLHVDYAQNEVRFLARMANENNLIKVIEDGLDIHKYTAGQCFKKPMEEVEPHERDLSKAGTFGLLYGKTVVSFAQDMMKGDLEAAKAFFALFFGAFPGIDGFIKSRHNMVLEKGYVETIWGDPIYIDTERYREDEVLRRAQNYPIQSSASSLGAHAVSLLNEAVIKNGLQAIPLGFCHDAADWEVELSSLLKFLDLMQKYMVQYIRKHYLIPVDIDWGIGCHQNHNMKITLVEGNVYKFSCPDLTFHEIIDRLNTYFKVTYDIKSEKGKHQSLSQLFGVKGSFSKYFGTTIKSLEGTLVLEER